MATATHKCRLYLITPPTIADIDAFARDLDAALSVGEVAALQIRLKDTPPDHIRRVTTVLAPVAYRHGTAVLMNDFVELAKELADHLVGIRFRAEPIELGHHARQRLLDVLDGAVRIELTLLFEAALALQEFLAVEVGQGMEDRL